jgi:hypothetical protein
MKEKVRRKRTKVKRPEFGVPVQAGLMYFALPKDGTPNRARLDRALRALL